MALEDYGSGNVRIISSFVYIGQSRGYQYTGYLGKKNYRDMGYLGKK